MWWVRIFQVALLSGVVMTQTPFIPSFRWETGVLNDGIHSCINIKESANGGTAWELGRYLCSTMDISAWVWNTAGIIENMHCIRFLEASGTTSWDDNYLCIPFNDPFVAGYAFSGNLPVGGIASKCVSLDLPISGWWDNYFCLTLGPVPHFDFHSSTPSTPSDCVQLYESSTSWNDNYLCSNNHDLNGWRWSYAGKISTMPSYVQFYEDDVGWDNNYLHYPASENLRYRYSYDGPLSIGWNTHIYESARTTNGWTNNYFAVGLVTSLARMSAVRENDAGYPASALPTSITYGSPSAVFVNGDVHLLVPQSLVYASPNTQYNHGNHIIWRSSSGFDSSSKQFNLGKASLFTFHNALHIISLQGSTVYIMPYSNLAAKVEVPGTGVTENPVAIEWGDRLYTFSRTSNSRIIYHMYYYSVIFDWMFTGPQDQPNTNVLSGLSCALHTEKSTQVEKIFCFYLTTSNRLTYRTYVKEAGTEYLASSSPVEISVVADAKAFAPCAVEANGQLWVFSVRNSDKLLTAIVLDGPFRTGWAETQMVLETEAPLTTAPTAVYDRQTPTQQTLQVFYGAGSTFYRLGVNVEY